jgi:glycosyltransferase involved in cell wall biosynthesis
VRAGGALTPEQAALADRLGVRRHLIELPHLTRPVLAAVYRRVHAVLLPSEREGFGLPLLEALACGTPVIATDLPVFREIAGPAAVYCPLSEPAAWAERIVETAAEAENPEEAESRRRRGMAQAARFSWHEHARALASLYREVVDEPLPSAARTSREDR